jgi:hypothetical protein
MFMGRIANTITLTTMLTIMIRRSISQSNDISVGQTNIFNQIKKSSI